LFAYNLKYINVSEGEFELSDEESWELNGYTELTVGRSCSGKHVIEISVIGKATRWRLCKRKAVRICTVSERSLVNCSMTDVGNFLINIYLSEKITLHDLTTL